MRMRIHCPPVTLRPLLGAYKTIGGWPSKTASADMKPTPIALACAMAADGLDWRH